jgi:hypothetical protein
MPTPAAVRSVFPTRRNNPASEVIWAMMEATYKVDPGGHFERVCAAVRLRAGGNSGAGAAVVAAAVLVAAVAGRLRLLRRRSVMALQRQGVRPLQAATVVGLLWYRVGRRRCNTASNARRRPHHEVFHLLCLSTASGVSRVFVAHRVPGLPRANATQETVPQKPC